MLNQIKALGCLDNTKIMMAYQTYLELAEKDHLSDVSCHYHDGLDLIFLVAKKNNSASVYVPLHSSFILSPSWILKAQNELSGLHKNASYRLGQFEKAAEAYEKDLQFDPTNVQMKDSFGPGAGFNNLFNHPNLFAKLPTDPRTKPYLNDPSFVQILNNLRKNPDSIKLYLEDPRILTTLSSSSST
ncbi:hypothetical protein V9T40_014738 [Parthenolecanium corni]|uniref:STI1/HOP DP domain-containing protein n=1 Tax=Parthenolecanium corni TaxID=536013 RepID=A0AAN9TH30_9HEMI